MEGYDKPVDVTLPQPIWEAIQRKEGGDYEKAVHFVLVLADALQVVSETRFQQMIDAIRRAQYEEALLIAFAPMKGEIEEFLREMAGEVEYSQRRFKGGEARREEAQRLLSHRATYGIASATNRDAETNAGESRSSRNSQEFDA